MLYKRSNSPYWYMDFQVCGQRVNKSTKQLSKRKAVSVEAAARQEIIESGGKPELDGHTLGEAMDRMIAERWNQQRDHSVFHRVRVLREILGDDLMIEEISAEEVSYLHSKLLERGIKTSTINRYSAALRAMLNTAAKEWGWLSSCPYIRTHAEHCARLRVVTKEEEERLYELFFGELNKPEVGHLIRVLINTGMRIGEALALKWDDVSFTHHTLTVWDQKGGGFVKARTVPMNEDVEETLKTIKEKQPEGCAELFPTLSYKIAKKWWNRARDIMKLKRDPQFVPHALRHTLASRLARQGVGPLVLMKLLGHSTLAMTERYAHLNNTALVEAMGRLNSYTDDGEQT